MPQEISIRYTGNCRAEKDSPIWSLSREKKFADKPALVVELKWDKSAEGAIQQIKKKRILPKPGRIPGKFAARGG